MPSSNIVIIATAGSGKTTGLVREALAQTDGHSALVTYTLNSTAELREKTIAESGFVPEHVRPESWFTFLLRHLVRPYQRALYEEPIRRLHQVEGQSTRGVPKRNTRRYYLGAPDSIFSDKISEFACAVIEATNGKPLRRLEKIFKRLYIDEIQDLAGYDLELLDHLLSSEIDIKMVGDIRQATYKTNNSRKNKQFSGPNIIAKFKAWEEQDKLEIQHQTNSYRCVQAICDLADMLYPDLPDATSLNSNQTEHDGVFAIRKSDVESYMQKFRPQTLRLDKRTREVPGQPINFGAAKGCTFDRVLIFPHGNLLAAIKHGDVGLLGNAQSTIAKVYVAITRARQSVGFVIPDNMQPTLVPLYTP